MAKGKNVQIELKIPSEFGYEKIAMSTVATIAGEFGFTDDKIQDIKTAVSEACINAIEHGNKLQEDKNVVVMFKVNQEGLTIDVLDEGKSKGFKISHSPDLEEKLKKGIKKRGWGLFLIETLVDDVEVVKDKDNAPMLRMVIHFERKNKNKIN
jgi:serine/threonine-protein kinase RsbW